MLRLHCCLGFEIPKLNQRRRRRVFLQVQAQSDFAVIEACTYADNSMWPSQLDEPPKSLVYARLETFLTKVLSQQTFTVE